MCKENTATPVFYVQQHLDKAGIAYLSGINGADSESYYTIREKLSLLSKHVKNPGKLLTVGAGAGDEIEVLEKMFPFTTHYIGLDLSSIALSVVKNELGLSPNLDLTLGNAARLPFSDNALNCIVYSAILHEVFSYLPQGEKAWSSAIGEGFRVLAPGGYMLVRDPAAPREGVAVDVTFKTEFAKNFYDYFSHCYRVENDSMNGADNFPCRKGGQPISLERAQVGELLMHFRNFTRDFKRGLTHFGDLEWKEIREAYFVYEQGVALAPDAYVKRSLDIGEKCSIILVDKNLSPRPETNQFLSEHFNFTNHKSSMEVIAECTQKMELLFQKKGV